jgi:hypothetical protein
VLGIGELLERGVDDGALALLEAEEWPMTPIDILPR